MSLFLFSICLYFCRILHLCCCNVTQQYKIYDTFFNKDTSKIKVNTTKQSDEDVHYLVLNGSKASISEVPYQVAIMIKMNGEEYEAICGGSIIGLDRILTTAHCVISYIDNIEKLNIVAGQLWRITFYGMQGQWRRAHKIKYPSDYKFPRSNICLIELDKPFVFNEAVQAIPYATEFEDYNTVCKACGYGTTSKKYNQNLGFSLELLVANLKIYPVRRCNEIYRARMNNFICTSDKFQEVIQGDSGWPLVCSGTHHPSEGSKGILVGLVCGTHENLTMRPIFTRVSPYKEFIDNSSDLSLSNSSKSCTILVCFIVLLYSYRIS